MIKKVITDIEFHQVLHHDRCREFYYTKLRTENIKKKIEVATFQNQPETILLLKINSLKFRDA